MDASLKEENRLIIDAHVHVFDEICGRINKNNTTDGGWGAVKCGNDFIKILPPYNKKTQFGPKSLIKYMDYENIDRAVLLQGSFWGNQNRLVKQALVDYQDRLAGAMYIEPWQDNAMEYFEKNIEYFNAIKLEISEITGFSGWNKNFKLTDYMWLFKELAKRNKTLVLDLGRAGSVSYQTGEVRKIINKNSDIKIVICHLAQPRKHYFNNKTFMDEWKNQIKLSKYGNVSFDTASLSAYFFKETYPYVTGKKFFDMAMEIAGPKKIIMGTDMPGNSLKATYRQMIYLPEIYGKYIGLSREELADIMGNNARRIYF